MKRWWLLIFGLILFSFSVNAIPCDGYWNGELSNPVSFVDCDFDCDNYDYQNLCEGQDPNKVECFGEDSVGVDGPPDGVGDVLHKCQWNNNQCINWFHDGDSNVVYNSGSTDSFSSYSFLESVCYNPLSVPDSCDWLKGSFVIERGFCQYHGNPPLFAEIKGLSESDPYQNCVNDVNNLFDLKEAWGQNTRAVQLPGFSGGSSSYRLGGFCLNYCREYSGYVDDFGLCGNDGGVVNGWAHNNCPNVRYEDSCAGSILREYSCDGTQTNPSTTWADGVNYLLTTTDCYSPGGPATCDNSCGTSSNSGTDTCRLGDGGGYCTGTGLNARCESGGSSPDLDDGESYVTEFNNECSSGGGWTGSVDWANGGSIGYYGEYNNELYWKEAIIYDEGGIFIFGQNDTSDRGDFETEACGDDENEFFIGGLCCDDSNDQILSNVIDNIDDIFDMNGSYCMDANIGSCGNLVKDSWEQCDGLYIDYNRTILAGSNMATTSELYLVLGNDSACGGDICDLNTCTCSGSPPINCQLGNAHWGPTKSNDNVVEGETIDLIIDGTDCDGLGVEFFVKESDGVFGVQDWDSADWVLIYGNSPIGSATFEGNKANFTWTSVWTDDDDSWDSDPEYIFRAISTSDSSLYKNSFDELKVSQNPAGDCEIDLGEECCIAGEVCSGGNWDGSGAICSAGESCCLTVCSNPLDYPGSIDGTYMGWGECIDDGDGDSVGIRKTYLYNSTTGILINEIGSEECIFGEEEIPFFSNFAMFLVFFILIGFYFWNRKK